MFPTNHSRIYRNEEGEVLGWDNESSFEPEYDPDLYLDPGYDWCAEHEQANCGEDHDDD